MLIGEAPRGMKDHFSIGPRVLTIEQACVYTNRTRKQIEYAVSKGWLRWIISLDNKKSLARDDLDVYLGLPERKIS